MLVLLIGVTTMFLLIMGTVSTLILAGNVTRQFRGDLVAESTYSPADIGEHPNGYAAVLISRMPQRAQPQRAQPPRVQPLTGSTAATSALTTAVTSLVADGALRRHGGLRKSAARTPFALTAPGGTRLLAVARVVTRAEAGGPGVLVVAQPTSAASQQVRRFIFAELITGGALIALLAVGGQWLIGRGLEPLRQMADTADDITSRGDLTARMPDDDVQTEVGRLGSAINTMLDRIQHAFGARVRSEKKVREFAADASHELRTPLTTIRGYAELYRQGALGDAELPNAMRRIEQEARRMSTLVAELLELARLDRTSSLDLTETDLAALVRDAVADCAAVQPERPVRAQAPPELVAVVDERRIRQVLANLLGNVCAHTPVTAPVTVTLSEAAGGVAIEVADAGPGMPAQDAARAFDRFHRAASRQAADDDTGSGSDTGTSTSTGTSSAADQSAGSGLGLSIVQAIAHAHGGRAALESAPEQGTTVRVWLPVVQAEL